MDNKLILPKIFHSSDWHLSFTGLGSPSGLDLSTVAKPMDKRTWSVGNDNYVNYLPKLVRFSEENCTWSDIVCVTGDLTHDMSKKHIHNSIRWIDRAIRGIKVLIRGNHDWAVDFGDLRHPDHGFNHTLMIEEGGLTCLLGYAFGCWSNHSGAKMVEGVQEAFTNREAELIAFGERLVDFAKRHKKTPVLLSHYPVPFAVAEALGKMGIKGYLSGHVHCTNNKVLPAQADWTWYELSAAQTDDKVIEGCYFSTGTTDVLLNKTGKIMKRVDDKIKLRPAGPKPSPVFPKAGAVPADMMWICVGLPGSGKSTWAKKAAERQNAEYICQDELGSREACEMAVAKALSLGKRVIVDRTNVTEHQRKHWLDLARRYKVKEVTCMFFDISKEVCLERVKTRTDHPTINDRVPMENREKIVNRFASELKEPNLSEGFKMIFRLREKDLETFLPE